MEINQHIRQSGRTWQMIEKALKTWEPVTLLATSEGHRRTLTSQVYQVSQELGMPNHKVTVQVVPDDFDWRLCKSRNFQGLTIVDHFAIEQKIQELDQAALEYQQLARQLYAMTL